MIGWHERIEVLLTARPRYRSNLPSRKTLADVQCDHQESISLYHQLNWPRLRSAPPPTQHGEEVVVVEEGDNDSIIVGDTASG